MQVEYSRADLDLRQPSSAVARACSAMATQEGVPREMDEDAQHHSKAEELRAFLGLSVVLAPVLAVAAVAGYGFLVWMLQLVAGPPGTQL